MLSSEIEEVARYGVAGTTSVRPFLLDPQG